MSEMTIRKVYFVSDGTGISVETVGKSLLTQFKGIKFDLETIRYVNNIDKANEVVEAIAQHNTHIDTRPIMFFTVVDDKIRQVLQRAIALSIDVLGSFLSTLELELGVQSNCSAGLSHSGVDNADYDKRIDALNFTLTTDDGTKVENYKDADIILVGVSRSGKTPTCLYLALHYSIKAANYPIVPEDFENVGLPKPLKGMHDKMFGLSIDPERLHQIRNKRRPNSDYSSYARCELEIEKVKRMYVTNNVDYLDSSQLSVEELATKILKLKNLHKASS
ncbi:MAG: kinase/pyrophosphorylase [Francisellaceae bacterium]|jgi:[pyruvate, water dikinase]-phosphate phosphotransferase / [pyruvate, water dikinase] kinase|nr:kinase/pyrophosphorylase [Francisellaceae bacterium]MBT6207576.1 kinase/pyrophosphorylase [Francisellaceae bacterium]MBT6539820.1 kinase/pyrophosphorylase [Francisellaceae bacterium]